MDENQVSDSTPNAPFAVVMGLFEPISTDVVAAHLQRKTTYTGGSEATDS